MPLCVPEVYCAAAPSPLIYAGVATAGGLIVLCAAACILITCREFSSPLQKYKYLLAVVGTVAILIGVVWVTVISKNEPVGGRNAVSNFAAPDLLTDKYLLSAAATIFMITKFPLLFVLFRRSILPFAGINNLFILYAVESIIIVAGLVLSEAILPSIRILDHDYPLTVMAVLVRSQAFPSRNTWIIQNVDTIAVLVFNFVILFLINQILNIRDFRELDEIRKEVNERSPMLGASLNTVMRGDKTESGGRRVAWFNLLRLILLCLGVALMLISNRLDSPVSTIIAIFAALHALCSMVTFVLFYRFYYRPVFLMTAAALNACFGLVMLGFLVFFGYISFVIRPPDSDGPTAKRTSEILSILGTTFCAMLVAADLAAAAWQIQYTIWATPILAGDISTTFDRHMHRIYDQDE